MNDDCIERCYICLENLYDHCHNLKCGCLNRYHTNCLETWLLIQNKCPICKKIINETQIQAKNYNLNTNDNNDYEEDNFELEVDDNDIFYNPLVYFISVYISYLCIRCIFYRIILD
jgi:hypothetical protein